MYDVAQRGVGGGGTTFQPRKDETVVGDETNIVNLETAPESSVARTSSRRVDVLLKARGVEEIGE